MLYRLLKIIAKIVISLKFKMEVIGKEHVVGNGPFIISSNHISAYDPILIGLMLDKDIHFLAKIELFHHPLLKWMLKKVHAIPVDRKSGMVIRPVRRALRLLQEGETIGIFPEGTRIKTREKVLPKKGVAFFGIKSGVPVLPIAVTIDQKKFRFRHKAVIHIGSPIDVTSFEATSYQELAVYIMEQSRELLSERYEESPLLLGREQRST